MAPIPGNSIVREFERKIASYCDSEFAMLTCNATIGIFGVFYALGLSNEEVVTTPLTWSGALSGLLALKCKIRFCDVEEKSLTLDPNRLGSIITPNTKAVFSTDFLGYPAMLDKIKAICDKYNIWLIHDGASSFGSRYNNHFAGYFADVTILSFGRKKLFTIGEGGCIITKNQDIYDKICFSLAHPERQDIETDRVNAFALNTQINPIAAEYGLNTFQEQFDNIQSHQNRVDQWYKDHDIIISNKNIQPNYHKVLVTPEQKKVLGKKINESLLPLPISSVVYQEPSYPVKVANDITLCRYAEWAVSHYSIYNLNG